MSKTNPNMVRRSAKDIPPADPAHLEDLLTAMESPVDTSDIPEMKPGATRVRRDASGCLPKTSVGSKKEYRHRFVNALRLICHAKPPDDLVDKWITGDESHAFNDNDTLQDWASCNRPYDWATGIATIDAAEALAESHL